MANLDRAMKRQVETFGAEAVRAWVMTNLADSYSGSRHGPGSSAPAGNRVLRSDGGRVLLDKEHPSDVSPNAPVVAAMPAAEAAALPAAPKEGKGVFSLW